MFPKYKEIVELIKKGSTVEAQEMIMDLREKELSLQEENLDLKETVKSLESKLHLKKKVLWEKPFYYIDDDGTKDGPYCQKCYDSYENLLRLQGGTNDVWKCFNCECSYKGPDYKVRPLGNMSQLRR